jgi:hypothetical protein
VGRVPCVRPGHSALHAFFDMVCTRTDVTKMHMHLLLLLLLLLLLSCVSCAGRVPAVWAMVQAGW